MSNWLTSDLHLGHAKVAAARRFDTIDHHDRVILNTMSKLVGPGNDLWVLGDGALGKNKAGRLRALPGALPDRRLHLVLGSHETIHPGNSTFADRTPWLETFDSIDTFAWLRHNGIQVLLSHFPYDGDNEDSDEGVKDRFEQWRLRDRGQVLAHGHTHSHRAVTASYWGTPQIHGGLDAWNLKPVPLSLVVNLANGARA